MPEDVKDPSEQEPAVPAVEEPVASAEDPVQPAGDPENTPAPEPAVVPDAPRRSAQRRIDELTRQKHDALREAEYWRAKAVGTQTPAPPTRQDREPQPESFDTQEDYIRAAARWEATQIQREAAEAGAAAKAEAERGEVLNKFERQLVKARQVHEDFDDVISQPVFTPAMQQAIFESELGAEVAYYLGTHEDEALRIAQLPPLRAVKEIAKLEIKLEAPAAPVPKKVSAAPAPIVPLKGGGPAVVDPSRMTTEEWMAWDKSQRLERLKSKPF
jgi:hypothetical protein